MEGQTTEKVLNHHLQSFGAGDVDAMLEDYTDESKIIAPDATLTGLDQIRALFDNFTKNMLPPGCEFEMIKSEIDGELAYVVWKAKSETHEFHIGTDTFIIRDGKIVKQTFAAHVVELS